MSRVNPDDLISYGPDANCVLDQNSPYYCPVSYSVYQYRPSLAANIIFLVIFFLFMLVHVWQGLKWRTWWYMGAMVLGCICEVLGYAGRIMLWQNPFDFNGFMLQIILITFGPAFFSAGIYFTLSKIVTYLGTEYSRLSPKAYYYIFIPCDLISLALQGAGGGMSSSSSGSSQTGVDIAIAGLSFQVVSLFIFIVLALDFAIRYIRGRKTAASQRIISTKFKTFIGFLSLAIVLILVRCSYRIAELHEGYMAPPDSLIHDQATFIGLEGVAIVIAVICLTIGHPGPVFAESNPRPKTLEHLSESGSDNTVPQTIPSEK